VLGDLLVLVHDAGASASTVRATLREWHHHERLRAALQMGDGDVQMYAPMDGPVPETSESVTRVWLAPPDRVREEREEGGRHSVAVRRGRRWWHHDPVNGTISNEDDLEVRSGVGQEVAWLLEPAALVSGLRLTDVRQVRSAGRPALRALGRPRRTAGFRAWIPMRPDFDGADEVIIDVDAEHGMLLRLEARLGGEPYSVRAVLEVAFGEDLAEETFKLQRPAGEPVRSPRGGSRLHHDIPIGRAVALAPFPVWILRRMPAGWEVHIAFAEEDDGPAQLFLHYQAEHGTQELVLAEMPAGADGTSELPGGSAWRPRRRGGRELELREPEQDWHRVQVRLALEGTSVLLHSGTLGANALMDAAAGLVRAPGTEPQLGR
jgi:hypothetical protein